MKIPRFLIQPLIENALNHAMNEHTAFLTILLHIYEDNDHLYLCVSDDGVGVPTHILEQFHTKEYWNQENKDEGKHIGLWNVNRRIQLICGESYGLNVKSKKNEGTTITIHLPNTLCREENV